MNKSNSMKQQIENIIKKNLPEKKDEQPYHNARSLECGKEMGFNQALSQIDTALIADEVRKIVRKEIYDCMCEHNEARHGDSPTDAYCRVLDLFQIYEY